MMRIPDHHLAALVRHFQANSDTLQVDGIYGPKTAREVQEYIEANRHTPDPEGPSPAIVRAFESALKDVGRGEDPPGSNEGPYVNALRDEVGLPRRGGGEWCAVFASVHLVRAGIMAKSRGAGALGRLLTTNTPGGVELSPSDLGPGLHGVVVRRREGGNHVQLFRVYREWNDLKVQHVGGNERHKVRTEHHTPEDFLKGVVQLVTVIDE